MYCPKCKKDVGNIEFCENCGAETKKTDREIAEEETAAAAVVIPDIIIKKISVKKIIAFALVAVIAVASYIGYKFFKEYSSPEQTAERYINALIAGEYEKAFAMLSGTDNMYITKEYFAKYMESQNLKGKKIVSLKQNKQYFTSQIDKEFLNLSLLQNGKKFFLFDNWKIDSGTFIKAWSITVPKGAVIKVEGKLVEKIKSTTNTSQSTIYGTPAKNTVTYEIEKIFPGEYEITASMPGANDVTTKVKTDKAPELKFELNDKLLAELSQYSDKVLNLYFANAGKDSFKDLINPDSQFVKNIGSYWYDKRSSYKNLKLESIETKSKVLTDENQATLIVVTTYSYEKEVGWKNYEPTKEEEEFTFQFLKNEKWEIDEIKF